MDYSVCGLFPGATSEKTFKSEENIHEADNQILSELDTKILTKLSHDTRASEIAKELSFSEHTVNAIASNAAKKLQCASVTAAVAFAIRQDLI